MSNKRRPDPLFPVESDYSQSKKMNASFRCNAEIYDFFDHLLKGGYVLARRDPETGVLRAMHTRPTVEHEVLVFRGVDKIAYQAELDSLRAAYPHLWEQAGLGTEGQRVTDVLPEFAEPKPVKAPESPAAVHDDMLVSMAEAWRLGVFTLTPGYSGLRVKLAICRRRYPELMPRMTPRGSQTLYRVGDLRAWEVAYTERAAETVAGIRSTRAEIEAHSEPVRQQAQAFNALDHLLSKIRGEKEDVRNEEG